MPTRELLTPKRAGLRALTYLASACLVAAALAIPATAGNRSAADAPAVQPAAAPSVTATLLGSREVPGPGDPNGRGTVNIALRRSAGKVCAHATWNRIGTPIGAHVHRGGPGVSGPVVIDLSGSVTGGSNCATGVSKRLIRKINAAPRHFYFNIHTNAYQAGAIRGQLH